MVEPGRRLRDIGDSRAAKDGAANKCDHGQGAGRSGDQGLAADFRQVPRILKDYSTDHRACALEPVDEPAGPTQDPVVDSFGRFSDLPAESINTGGFMRHVIARLRRIWRPAVGPDHRQALLERLPKGACCAEIGAWKGQFSMRIIETTKPKLLHLVDPWLFQPQFSRRHYGGRTARNQEDMDAIHNEVVKTFSHLGNVEVHRATSKTFFSGHMEGLDWIYIDGDHSTDAVSEDLNFAWERVKRGGLITGDDYYWSERDELLPVKIAVDNFCQQRRCSKELIGGQYIIRRE